MMEAARRAACGGKEPLSWAEAERRARGLRRRTSKKVTPYHCRACGGKHIGNQVGPNVSRRIKRDRLDRIDRREKWE